MTFLSTFSAYLQRFLYTEYGVAAGTMIEIANPEDYLGQDLRYQSITDWLPEHVRQSV
jgi:hypothetical protein